MKHRNIHKAFLFSDIVLLAAILAAGVVFLPFGGGWQILGLCIIVCDACTLPFYIHGYRIEGTHGIFREMSITVSRDEQDAVMAFLQGGSPTPDFQVQENGGALLSIYYQKDTDVAYAQFYEYSQIMSGHDFPLLKITPEQKEALMKMRG